MSKFAKDLNDELVARVQNIAREMHITEQGITVDVLRLKKAKNEVGIIAKSNDIASIYAKDEALVVVALYEEAFNRVTTEVGDFWIRNLLSQVSYDLEKDKITITKPELQIPLGMYRKYGNVAVQNTELALITLSQIEEEEKERKAEAAYEKRNKKKQTN